MQNSGFCVPLSALLVQETSTRHTFTAGSTGDGI